MIVLKNITKKIKNNIVLEDINLELKEGNIYVLFGRNGSGKTMLLRLIAKLILPTSGEFKNDSDNIGCMIEKPNFLPYLTGYENLKLLKDINNKVADDRINYYLKEFNLYSEKDKKYSEYSLGMKQKLGIIQAIMENQDVIILDESFNCLDEETFKILRETLIKLKKENKIIILATHIKEDVENIGDKTFYIQAGRLIKEGK